MVLGLLAAGCSFGRTPAVDDSVVLPLPAGFEVVARSNTACGGVDDEGGDWRDLVIRPDRDADTALAAIRAHLESRGFRFGSAPGSGTGPWPRYRGASDAVGAELGTAADYRRDQSQVGPNPAVVRSASGPSDLVLRLNPVNADCMT